MRIIKFYSPTCGPCKVMDANLKKSGISYENINVIDNEDMTIEHGIRAVPTLIKLDDEGNEEKRYIGVMDVEQIKEFAS